MNDSDAYDQNENYEPTDADRTDADRTDVDNAGSEPNRSQRGKWVSALVAVLGLWMIIQPFLFEMTAANFWNGVIIGIALVVLGGYNFYRRAGHQFGSVSVGVFVALLGIWIVASPYVFGIGEGVAEATGATFWNAIIVGAIVFLLGAYSAYEARERTTVAQPARQ